MASGTRDASWVREAARLGSSQSSGSAVSVSSSATRARFPGRSKMLLEFGDAAGYVGGAVGELAHTNQCMTPGEVGDRGVFPRMERMTETLVEPRGGGM